MKNKNKQNGAALVVTLIVLTALVVVAVSMVTVTSIDRTAVASSANAYRAELAAEAGLAQFLAQLGNATRSGDFSVLALSSNSSNATFTALTKFDPDSTSPTVKIMPFASRENSSANLTLSGNITMAGLFSTVDSAFPEGNRTIDLAALLKPQLEQTGGIEFASTNAPSLMFKCSLANMTTGSNNTAEFAYVVVDECAKLNLALFGANGSASLSRNETTVEEFPSRLPVAGVGNYTVGQGEFDTFKKLDAGIKSGHIWTSIYPTLDDRAQKNRFYSFHKGELVDFIPYGYSANGTWIKYQDGGKPKFDLNQMATASGNSTSNAEKIAAVISRNLKNFYKRDPSFENEQRRPAASARKVPSKPTLLYNERIAAAIVDYIDPDSIPTGVSDDALAGKEQTPYLMQIAERYIWKSDVLTRTGYDITLEQRVFIQLWNPYTQNATGSLRFELENFREFVGNPRGLSDAPSKIPKMSETLTVNLKPNEIRAFELGFQDILVKAENREVKADATTSGDELGSPEHTKFRVFWNGNLFDQTASYNENLFPKASGLSKPELAVGPANSADNPKWSVNLSQTTFSEGGIRRALGDPRQNQISNYTWRNQDYDSGDLRWNGRSIYGASGRTTQRYEETWVNRDPMRAPLHDGSKPPTPETLPTDPRLVSGYLTKNGDDAPFYLPNANMTTVAELGHIYDPAHLDDNGNPGESTTPPNSHYAFGGARSLRIGQPEFDYPTYNTAGQRAVSLLDIFTANSTDKNVKRQAGVNLNTAPVEVLTNMFLNLAQTADKGQKPATGNHYSLSLDGAKKIAENIVKKRETEGPFFHSSDFWRLGEVFNSAANFSPAFPTIASDRPKVAKPMNVLDRGREEIFRRAYNFLETKSGAFRFYGVGRSLAKNGSITSQVAIEALVELKVNVDSSGEPIRDSNGNPTLTPSVIWKKKL
jgi:hypothetical protein